jgi:murein DD-endopeptidase MepM/ murein hydrolase activator NlpD
MADSLDGLVSRLKQAEKAIDSLVKKSGQVNDNLNGTTGGGKGGKSSSGTMPSAKDMSAAMNTRTAMRAGGELATGFGAKTMGKVFGMQQPAAFDAAGGPGQFEKMQAIKQANEAKMEKMKDRAQTAYLGMRGISNRKTQTMLDENGEVMRDRDGKVMKQSRFAALSPESQSRIESSMYGLSDSVKLMQGMQNAFNSFLPSVENTMGRATGYYNAGIYSNTKPGTLSEKTFGRLQSMSAITSVGSDAKVAQFLASRGMSSNQDVYGETINTIGNAARYMNISNEDAASSIEGLTSAKGSAEMLRNFGIYTADLASGKEKTQGEIFEELAQRLTAGRGKATQEQTMSSIRRGSLGVTIDSFFSGDKQGSQMFKQYMIDRAKGGNKTDLSSATDVTSALASKNPLAPQMALDTTATEALNMSQESYIKGINMASNALKFLNIKAGELATSLGAGSAMIQTLFASDQVKGLIGGANTLVDFTSKGLAAIGQGLMAMDAINPAPALAEMGIIAGSMGLSLGAAVATTGAAQLIGGFGGTTNTGGLPVGTGGGGAGGGGTGGGGSGSLFDISQVSSGHRVNSPLGEKRGISGTQTKHGGTDYNYDIGDAVKAVADGTVTNTETNHNKQDSSGGSLGNFVTILHIGEGGKQYTSVYGHLSKVLVNIDDSVTKGQVIGKAGNTGRTSPAGAGGAHLHFEIREGRQTIGGVGNSIRPEDASRIMISGKASSSTTGIAATGLSPTAALSEDIKAGKVGGVAGLTKTPGNVQNAINALSGLYSNEPGQILKAIQLLGANVGLTPDNLNAAMAGNPGSAISGPRIPGTYSPVPGESTGVPIIPKENNINNNVNIVVQVPDVTAADAVKFGQLVKQYLDSDSLLSNIGDI